MTPAEFDALTRAAKLRKGKTLAAARCVLVEGMTATQAAAKHNINKGGLSRYLAKFPHATCPRCGTPIKEIKK